MWSTLASHGLGRTPPRFAVAIAVSSTLSEGSARSSARTGTNVTNSHAPCPPPCRPTAPAAARRRARGVRRAGLPPHVDERPGRGRRGHQAGAVPALRVEAGALPRAARRRRLPPPRRHRQGHVRGRQPPRAGAAGLRRPTSSSSATTRPPSRCSSAAAPAATRSSPSTPAGSRSRSPTPSPPSSTCPGLAEDERMLLAYGIVGLAEGTSRHWLREPRPRRTRRARRSRRRAGVGRPPRHQRRLISRRRTRSASRGRGSRRRRRPWPRRRCRRCGGRAARRRGRARTAAAVATRRRARPLPRAASLGADRELPARVEVALQADAGEVAAPLVELDEHVAAEGEQPAGHGRRGRAGSHTPGRLEGGRAPRSSGTRPRTPGAPSAGSSRSSRSGAHRDTQRPSPSATPCTGLHLAVPRRLGPERRGHHVARRTPAATRRATPRGTGRASPSGRCCQVFSSRSIDRVTSSIFASRSSPCSAAWRTQWRTCSSISPRATAWSALVTARHLREHVDAVHVLVDHPCGPRAPGPRSGSAAWRSRPSSWRSRRSGVTSVMPGTAGGAGCW